MSISPRFIKGLVLLSATMITAPSFALATVDSQTPSLIITSDPLPESLRQNLYRKPVRVQEITPSVVIPVNTGQEMTLVGRRVGEIGGELERIRGDIMGTSDTLANLERNNEDRATEYYANIATINTRLQSGTTPGNPYLVKRLADAEIHIEALAGSLSQFDTLAIEAAHSASEASFLLEETRAAYSISGAVEEDHVQLAQLEDSIHNTLTLVQRVLNNVNDDITRTSRYLTAERENLRILSLAVTKGDFYGRSLASRPFSNVPAYQGGAAMASTSAAQPASAPYAAPAPAVAPSALSGPRPLAKIKFDRPDVDYEEPVYMAINEALKRYPNARFDLVAVTPTGGNAARVAIESTKARRNAEKVLRALSQMGLEQNRVDLSYSESPQAASNEVHLFVK